MSPGATEVCNDVDDDCDGVVDDGTPLKTWWVDTDGDGYGVFQGDTVQACEQPVGYAGNDADCDDGEHDINPSNAWFLDEDEDGYGSPITGVETCHPLPGYVDNDLDCDDSDPIINPEGQEVCDDLDADEDCDGLVDDDDATAIGQTAWYRDVDEDGFGDAGSGTLRCDPLSDEVANYGDCDDTDSLVLDSCTFAKVSVSNTRSCALRKNGEMICWGGGAAAPSSPGRDLASTNDATCAALTDGSLVCWGMSTGWSSYALPSGPDFWQVEVGYDHAVALDANGDAFGFGRNTYGQADDVTGPFDSVHPVGFNATCGLDSTGAVTCWGAWDYLPDLARTGPYSLLAAAEGGGSFLCGVDLAGDLECWGRGTVAVDAGVDIVPTDGPYSALSCSGRACCAVQETTGSVDCWGHASDLQNLGAAPPEVQFVDVASTETHACGIDQSGCIECWTDRTDSGTVAATTPPSCP